MAPVRERRRPAPIPLSQALILPAKPAPGRSANANSLEFWASAGHGAGLRAERRRKPAGILGSRARGAGVRAAHRRKAAGFLGSRVRGVRLLAEQKRVAARILGISVPRDDSRQRKKTTRGFTRVIGHSFSPRSRRPGRAKGEKPFTPPQASPQAAPAPLLFFHETPDRPSPPSWSSHY